MEEQIDKKKEIIKKLSIFIGLFILFFSLLLLYSRLIGTSGLIVKEYKIESADLPSSFYGLKIVHISDIHYGQTIQKKELQNMINKINILKPDIVVLTGDLLDNKKTLSEKEVKNIIDQLNHINATIGKFAIQGEHDFDRDIWSTIIKESQFINLNDTYELIYKDGYEPILLAGLSTNLRGTKNAKDKITPINNYITSTLEEKQSNRPNFKILLLHEPDFVDQITYQNYNLILSGHSHKGQINLPFIGPITKPMGAKKYYKEYYQLENTDFYISSGLGTTKYNFRLFNRPSINFYRLVNQ